MASISIENDGFFIVDDQGNKRLFNDANNDPFDQISAALTVKKVVEKYVPQACSGNNPVVIRDCLWAKVYDYAIITSGGHRPSSHYNNTINKLKNNGWSELHSENYYTLLKNPNYPDDPTLCLGMYAESWPDYHGVSVFVLLSPTYKSGFSLSSILKVCTLNEKYNNVIMFENDDVGINITSTLCGDFTIDWSEIGVDPVIVGREYYTKDFNATISVSGDDVSVLVDNNDLSTLDAETKSEFVSLLYSLGSTDKGCLMFPGLSVNYMCDSDPSELLLNGDTGKIGFKDNCIVVTNDGKLRICYGPTDVTGGNKTSLSFICRFGVLSSITNINLIDCSYDFSLEYCLNNSIGKFRISWERLAVKGLCLAGV